MALDIQWLDNRLVPTDIFDPKRVFARIKAQSMLVEYLWERKFEDVNWQVIRYKVLRGEARKKNLYPKGVLRIKVHISVPRVRDLIRLDLEKAIVLLGMTL